MSERDRALLKIAGLTAADVARLFDRTRQAIHLGVRGPANYFSARETILIFYEAQRRDAQGLGELVAFIDTNYKSAPAMRKHRGRRKQNVPETELSSRYGKQQLRMSVRNSRPPIDHRDIVLPHRSGLLQLLATAKKVEQISVVLNDNMEHLAPTAIFNELIRSLLRENLRGRLEFVLPNSEITMLISQNHQLKPETQVTVRKVDTLPCVLCALHGRYRAFVIGRFSVEETNSRDAERLWWHVHRRLDHTNLFRGRAIIS